MFGPLTPLYRLFLCAPRRVVHVISLVHRGLGMRLASAQKECIWFKVCHTIFVKHRSASVFSSSNEDFRITEPVATLEGCKVRIAPL
jgi:hypothetical protein